MNLLFIATIVYLLNIPFGYWRTNVKKFSLQWILAIHLPVPLVILFRIYSNLGFELYTYPVLVATFFMGQFSGKKIFEKIEKRTNLKPSSCLIMDLLNYRKNI